MKITGYKVFNPDFKCRDFQFELGKTYFHEGIVELCKSGFHFCLKLSDCFSYYPFDIKNIVCEVECEGVSYETNNDSKRVCRKITIVKRLSWQEVLDLVNTGNENIGLNNSGNRNSGNSNSGNHNSGNHNSGNSNSGNRNSGSDNSGNYNSGRCNSGRCNSGNNNSGNNNSGYCNSGNDNFGNYNSGYFNSGNNNSGSYNSGEYNSGYFNSGNYSSGIFCKNKSPTIKIFDKESNITISRFMRDYFNYLKICYKNQDNWNNLSISEKEHIFNMPNFNKEQFEEIMRIKVHEIY